MVISAALLTVDCLVIMLRDVQHQLQLGELLRMGKDVLKSIDDYCNNTGESFLYHLISNWFRDGPEEPLKLLIAGLKSMGEDDIAAAISHLFSFGTKSYMCTSNNYTIANSYQLDFGHVCACAEALQPR